MNKYDLRGLGACSSEKFHPVSAILEPFEKLVRQRFLEFLLYFSLFPTQCAFCVVTFLIHM